MTSDRIMDIDAQTDLLDPVKTENEKSAKLLLRGMTNVNEMDKDGRTLLWLAAWKGQTVIVKRLLDTRDIDINLRNKSLFRLWSALPAIVE
jgi:ankyrin repeat protein